MISYRLKNAFYISIIFIASLVIIALGFYLFLEGRYDNRIYPGVFVNSLDLGGQKVNEARKTIQTKVDQIYQDGLKFDYDNHLVNIDPWTMSLNIESPNTDPILSINVDQTIDQAYRFNRDLNIYQKLKNQITILFSRKNIDLSYRLNEPLLLESLQAKYQEWEVPMQNADLDWASTTPDNLFPNIKSEQVGQVLDYETGIRELKQQLSILNNPIIKLNVKTVQPKITKEKLENLEPEIEKFLVLAPINFVYQESTTTEKIEVIADKLEVAKWLGLGIQEKDSKPQVVLVDERLKAYLTDKLAAKIDREPAKARFEMRGTRVVNFQTSADGLKVDIEKMIAAVRDYFVTQKLETINVVTQVVVDDSVNNVDSFGIKEIIGTGHSNFAGSPKNRRHNIKVGAAAVNGLLVKPGEEFSLVKALGEVDAKAGYLPELVIKENKTIPEYGGGLCQIGTTLFRAALESGLPITARRNHSYRVRYYEPAGMDAAVYIPNPDVRFLNDTSNYVLIQTRIKGDDIYFDFWGVKDGRKIEISKPAIYNIVKPAPTKILESTDIPEGQKKCTESPHNGADAYFDYKVTYRPGATDEEIKEKRFASHYVPWQEVCLVGVKELSASSTPTISTSTPPSTSATTTPSN